MRLSSFIWHEDGEDNNCEVLRMSVGMRGQGGPELVSTRPLPCQVASLKGVASLQTPWLLSMPFIKKS